MSVILEQQDSIYISTADNTDPNVVISQTGSRISINLNDPLSIPASSLYSSMEVTSASIWNVAPNITEAYQNNSIIYIINLVAQTPIIFPNGQYSLTNLNQSIANELSNRGQDSTLFSFAGDEATQSVIIVFKTGVQIDFGAANSVGSILGFPASEGLVPNTPAPFDGYSVIADEPATLNRINNYLLLSDIAPTGIPLNNRGAAIVASIPISARPGSLIIYAPPHPSRVNISALRGRTKPTISFQLVDQLLRPVDTLGESWTALVTFRYAVLLSTESVPLMDI